MYVNTHSYYSFKYGTLSEEDLLVNAQKCGVTEFALTDIEKCIASVQNDESYFSESIKEFLENQIPDCNLLCLTPSERQVLKLVAKNKTAQEIGDVLFISRRTVEKHRSHIIKKLKLESSQNSLLLFAKENEKHL